jgi:heme exporter protein A
MQNESKSASDVAAEKERGSSGSMAQGHAPAPKRPVIRMEGVEKWFGFTRALQGINLVVWPGDFLALLGRNGAGKSTLLRVIARLAKPSSGRILVKEIDISRHTDLVRLQLGFVAHSSFLYPNLTARENLRFFGRMYRIEKLEDRIEEALHWVGLDDSADRRVKGFSRGMQQRLSIARATLHDPEILLMDEPFSGLDLEASTLLSTWMRDFVGRGKTILMATHDLEQGLESVNRWALLEKGTIAEEFSGDSGRIRERYKQFLRERRGAFS